MNSSFSYVGPFGLALVFHAAVIWLMMLNWNDSPLIETPQLDRYFIEASLVGENPYRLKEGRVKEGRVKATKAQAKRESDTRQAARKKEIKRQNQLNQVALEAAKRRDLEKQLTDEMNEVSVDAPDMELNEQEQQTMAQNLSLAIIEEQQLRNAITDDEKAMAYVSQIKRDIVQNWSRPPSARNGMQALLRVHLVPTGEVVDVVVEESSGNDAFDRSATLAVEKAERFQVPGDSRQFERNFREFTVLFRPEDLRL